MISDRAGKIIILTGASIGFNPRVLKEAQSLASNGFFVSVFTNARCSQDDVRQAERNNFLLKFFPHHSSSGWYRSAAPQLARIQGRIARELFQRLKYETRWQIGPRVFELYSRAKKARAEFYISHLESGIWAGQKLLEAGFCVGVDMEDWFSEDLLPEARRHRPIRLLRRLEQVLLTQGAFASCPSEAMSRALAQEFGCSPPTVIYNAFSWKERCSLDGLCKDRIDVERPSIHWFSQTIGPGRGLEDLLAALPQVTHRAEIHLRGNPVAGFERWLTDHTPEAWRGRIFVHELVSNQELLSRTAEHDIGFAGEMKYCRNKDLTVSNKLLQYLLAGLAVVASDTAGQREVAEQAGGAVLLYPSGEPEALAAQLNGLLGSPERLNRAKATALSAAEKTFCWERQEGTLLEGVKHALGHRADRSG